MSKPTLILEVSLHVNISESAQMGMVFLMKNLGMTTRQIKNVCPHNTCNHVDLLSAKITKSQSVFRISNLKQRYKLSTWKHQQNVKALY